MLFHEVNWGSRGSEDLSSSFVFCELIFLTFIDLSPDASVIDSVGEGEGEMEKGQSLADVVNCFNDFYEAFLNAVTTESADPQVPWQRLADLERRLNVCSGKTLLTCLADASAEGFEGSKPKVEASMLSFQLGLLLKHEP